LTIREPSNPVSISTFPSPSEIGYRQKPGHFGPLNLHENRPGSFVSSRLIFATYQNVGVRVFDVSDPYRPVEVGAFVPPQPAQLMDHRPNRPNVIQSSDVFVDAEGLVYSTDYNGGLNILEFQGSDMTLTEVERRQDFIAMWNQSSLSGLPAKTSTILPSRHLNAVDPRERLSPGRWRVHRICRRLSGLATRLKASPAHAHARGTMRHSVMIRTCDRARHNDAEDRSNR